MYLQNPETGEDYHHNHFLFLYGATGVGKSKFLNEFLDNLNYFYKKFCVGRPQFDSKYEFKQYFKSKDKWWDHYNYEDVIIIDEVNASKTEFLGDHFKEWFDQTPFKANVKGSMLNQIRPKFILMASNFTFDQCFPKTEDNIPLRRKIQVHEMKEGDNFRWPNWNM
ncbi:hypothetical protein BCR36DRAFT_296208, partial [Piromyces finnis]